MKTLTVLLLALVATTALTIYPPWQHLEDIPNDIIVGTTTMFCPDGPVLTVAIHDPATGYWMLWLTAKAWILAPFGIETPVEGTLSHVNLLGLWKTEGTQSRFMPSKEVKTSYDREANYREFCKWLWPPEKPSA